MTIRNTSETHQVPDGPRRIIAPAEAAWDDFFDAPGTDWRQVSNPRCRSARAVFNAIGEALSISDVVLYELLSGAERSNDPARIRREVEHFAAG
jgi:hypothetical protein